MEKKADIRQLQIDSKEILMYIWGALVLIHTAVLVIRYLCAIYNVDPVIISNNLLYIVPVSVLPFLIWVFSTKHDYWNVYQRKLFMIGCVVLNAVLSVFQPVYSGIWSFIVPKIYELTPTEVLTEEMIVTLARAALFLSTLLICGLVIYNIFGPLYSDRGREKVLGFKVSKIVDTREYKENLYDFCVCKRLDNGKPVTVTENDRFIHTLVNGVSGTGKTSTTLVVSIYDDLLKKVKNREKRQEALLKMVLADKAKVMAPLPKNRWDDPVILPRKKYRAEYDRIYKEFPDCGITVMAPNSGLTDDVVRLCEALSVPVQRIDPMPDEKTYKQKTHLIGLNPFYIPEWIKGPERVVQTYQRATNFAETLQQIFDASGASDPYFAGVNTAITTNVTVACIIGSPYMNHRQANIRDIQECISDFSKLKEYVEKIETHLFGEDVRVKKSYSTDVNMSSKNKRIGDDDDITKNAESAEIREKEPDDKNDNDTDEDNAVIDSGLNPAKLKEYYYSSIFYIRQELLGEGNAKMFDQGRGLRNMINSFLANPRISNILTMDRIIDFDDNLRCNKVTVINTAIELGDSVSTAFGSLFIFNMVQAVFRRPPNTMADHFWYVDELPVYLHPVWERMVALFRQYRVALIMAIQTLDQFEKTAVTRYLKTVMMGCATHIVFGRLSPTDMKMYQDKSGVMEIQLSQKTTSQSASILAENANATVSERLTPTKVNMVEGSQMSKRDFQEVTIFTVNNGNVGDPTFAKTSFLNRNAFLKRRPQIIHWENLMSGGYMLKPDIDKRDAVVSKERRRVAEIIINDADGIQDVIDKDAPIEDERKLKPERGPLVFDDFNKNAGYTDATVPKTGGVYIDADEYAERETVLNNE